MKTIHPVQSGSNWHLTVARLSAKCPFDTALLGAKLLQKPKKPTCLGEASAETEACLSVTAYRREARSPFC